MGNSRTKYKVIDGKEDRTVMCKEGVFYLGMKLSQLKLKKLYNLGFTNLIEAV
jgi:hypothetical protein